jgi:pimeloyl-ACP methyl ester carboxylesterase
MLRKGECTGVDGFSESWEMYDRVRCPVLLIRGALSDILTAECADQMTKRGPCARVVVVENVGHAPFFNTPDQVHVVEEFFDQP